MFTTPVLFLIFNRPDITQKVFDQIRKVKPKYLFVAADGPRDHRPEDAVQCKKTRAIIDQVDWDCEIHRLFREKNMGCGPAVAGAISWYFDQVDSGIVLEDDCFPDTSFFYYCEELLLRYKENNDIMFIGGNNFQAGTSRGEDSYYFSRYPTSWGWASWRRSWKYFESDISNSSATIVRGDLDAIFNSKNEKNHWKKSLEKAGNESHSVWDFYFYYAIWKRHGICITPNQNLVINLGFFDQGTHFFLKDSIRTDVKAEKIALPLTHPQLIEIHREADIFTFNQFYSHSLKRTFRILRENKLTSIIKYLKLRFL